MRVRKQFPRFSIKSRWLRLTAVTFAMTLIIPYGLIRGLIDFAIAMIWTVIKVYEGNW